MCLSLYNSPEGLNHTTLQPFLSFVIVTLLQLFHLEQLGFQVHDISGLCGLKHGLFKEKRNNAKFMNHLQYIHHNQTCRLACMFFSVEYIIFSFQSSIKARQKITNDLNFLIIFLSLINNDSKTFFSLINLSRIFFWEMRFFSCYMIQSFK